MSGSHLKATPLGLLLLALARTGQSVVYVTDLPLFSRLAPCAASAISYHIMSQTRANCPQAVTDLQGCVCTKNNNIVAISSGISSSVSYSCGSTASDDQASAATVLSAYCNQNAMPTFAPPSITVTNYISDLPEFQYLAGCAKGALGYAVQSMTNSFCPPEASNLATCACMKNQNSLKVSQIINSSVRYSCTSHMADVTSAQAMFSAYCNMAVSGISNFPQPSPPPGDMSYYITALPQYSAMAPCAQSAVSYAIKSQANNYCPEGVQALASCVCIKESIFGSVSSSVTSGVKWSCSSTASEDITSALAVLDVYCSAAKGQVKPTGIAESIQQTFPVPRSGTIAPGPGQTGGAGGGSGNGGGAGGGGANGGPDGSSGTSQPSNTGVIAGAAGGGVALLLGIGVAVFYLMRNARRKKAAEDIAMVQPKSSADQDFGGGKPELDGAMITAADLPPSSPSPSMLKTHASQRIADNVSPVSAHHNHNHHQHGGGGGAFPSPPMPTELHNESRVQQQQAGAQNVSPVMPSPYSQNGQFQAYGQQQQQQQQYQPGGAHEMLGQQTYSTMIRPELHGSYQQPLPLQQAGPYGNVPASPFGPGFQGQAQGLYEFPAAAIAAFPRPPSSAANTASGLGASPPRHTYEPAGSRPATASSQQHLRPSEASAPGMSWHSGPVAGYSELDGGGGGRQPGATR
ncbi:hypothetical protein GGTG_06979 [Gaeumannomyces tritici R3-111a-1]|uniref:Extracellular membrane protein CFEM domain-containing protein n=1 Tax=Gaeumannomyces tritici (strain R3-111a-1) TaxID=644352 RepID=J3P0D2_GAET3|nr:hypothetical protein GGTG_06979 [Gaeumannomyces tritici R3-111a-1]EJT77065.1 hypothetical protein GGTG_06979 [Gaeumannomyces tritici R3-111a-1]